MTDRRDQAPQAVDRHARERLDRRRLLRGITALAGSAAAAQAEASGASVRSAAEGAGGIGYRATGAGAVARTLAAKIAEIGVSVDDYGAVGDGVADDGPKIVAAQNALKARGGGELLFTAGRTYRVERPIPMESGVTYKGSGRSGVNQIAAASGAKILVAGPSAFINAAEARHEIAFEDMFLHSGADGGHILDWSLSGVTAKIRIDGCTFVQERPDKHIIKGGAAGGVFSIRMHDCDWQYAAGNTVSPISFVSPTINSVVIERCWSTCAAARTSGVHAIRIESLNPAGPAINCVVRDTVFELPGGGSVKMLSCVQSGVEDCAVYDLSVPPARVQFEIGDGASGPPSNNCWLKGVRSKVGTAAAPDCRIDCSVAGQSAFIVDQCAFSRLDGGGTTPGILIVGGDIGHFQNIAYVRLGASAAGDLHFGSTDAGGKSWTFWNGYPGNAPGFLNIALNGAYVGGYSPAGLLQWGGTRGAPAFYVSQGGALNTRGPIYPATPAGADQAATAILAGTGPPSNGNGNNGDFYLRADGTGASNSAIYHKEGGAWVALTTS